MYENPTQYCDPLQLYSYRRKAIRTALLITVSGIAIWVLDVILFSYLNFSFSSGFTSDARLERYKRREEGVALIFLLYIVIAPPYGVYRLLTLNKRIKKLALLKLIKNNPQLKEMHDTINASKDAKLTSIVNTQASIITKIFFVLISLFLLMCIAIILFAVYRNIL